MSLTLGQFGREKAEAMGCKRSVIDALNGCATVDMFLVTWRWQIAPFVHRYPSPIGRLGCTPYQAPEFFCSRSYRYCSLPEQTARGRISARVRNPGRPVGVGLVEATITEGADTCSGRSNQFTPLPPSHSSDFRLAETLWANRRSWVARPVLAQPSQQGPIRQPARSSVVRAMSRIARPTRRAADAARPRTDLRNATAVALGCGGLFHAIAAGRASGQEKNDGKGQTCSTRS